MRKDFCPKCPIGGFTRNSDVPFLDATNEVEQIIILFQKASDAKNERSGATKTWMGL